MNEQFLANLIRLTLLDIAAGNNVTNKLNLISSYIKGGTAVLPESYNMVHNIQYELKMQASRSKYWKNAHQYNKLWNIVANKSSGHSFIARNPFMM